MKKYQQETRLLLKNIDQPGPDRLTGYLAQGGYQALAQAVQMSADQIIEEIKRSGLRGRGGAGFLTGMKWAFVPRNGAKPVYLLCNADESEPGTFKDRVLMEYDPHLLIEGIIISCLALNCHTAFIYIRGEYAFLIDKLVHAIDEARAAGYLGEQVLTRQFPLDIIVHKAAGAYICGEETALIESLEGYRGYPRLRPPYPAVHGLLQSPTVINNVETLCAVPWIIQNGANAYAAYGTQKSSGTKLISISGAVNRPGVYEIEMGFPLHDFIFTIAGGITAGRRLKAVVPGGSSVPVLRADEIENITIDYESMMAAGTMLGSGGMIVFDETAHMPSVLQVIAGFYAHESCGQCSPCREGTGWAKRVLDRLLTGQGLSGDIDLLVRIADMMEGKTICALADADAMPLRSFVKKFRNEFEALLPTSLPTRYQRLKPVVRPS
ncbi:MAG: NADH-quinone oxidoreductase subunit NuoF [Acidobacteriota bacterium]